MPIRYIHARTEMLDYLPDGATSILDVGCSSGEFGKQLRNLSSDLRLDGFEPDADAAAVAAQTYDHVAVGLFPQACHQLPPDAHYNVIYFNDVLEHMPEPAIALFAAKDLLLDDGVVIASIPNVRHVSVLGPLLLQDEFRYRDSGILDTTHLRFFTRRSILRMFIDADWEVLRLQGINRVLRVGEPKTTWWVKLLGTLTRGRSDALFFVQYVIVARPRSSPDISRPPLGVSVTPER